jgi:hypothetical protein
MDDNKQSEGREENAASPVEDWEANGILDKKQREDAEATGRTAQVTGEKKSFLDVGGGQHQNLEEAQMMREPQDIRADADPNDLTGPAGDPAEGPRDTSPS